MSWNPDRHPIPATTRRRILDRDGHTCQLCNGTRCGNQRLEIDHRVPFAEGGTDADENLWALGATPCHATKTEQERRRGLARKSTKRPPRPHPGYLA